MRQYITIVIDIEQKTSFQRKNFQKTWKIAIEHAPSKCKLKVIMPTASGEKNY